MPLSWNQIKKNAVAYSKKWENEERERAEKDSFWNDFFSVFTIPSPCRQCWSKPHQELDKVVDLYYRPQPFKTKTTRIEYLFDLYNEYTAPLLKVGKRKSQT